MGSTIKIPWTIAVDFDGTLATWIPEDTGPGILGDPLPGAISALKTMRKWGWLIIIYTARLRTDLIEDWLKSHGAPFDHINSCPHNVRDHLHPCKVAAHAYVDDKGVCFRGDWSQTLDELATFKPWHKATQFDVLDFDITVGPAGAFREIEKLHNGAVYVLKHFDEKCEHGARQLVHSVEIAGVKAMAKFFEEQSAHDYAHWLNRNKARYMRVEPPKTGLPE